MAGSQRRSLLGGSHTFPLSPSRWSWLIAGELTETFMSQKHPLGSEGLILLPVVALNSDILWLLYMPI